MIAELLLAAVLSQPPPAFATASEVVLLDAFVTRGGEPLEGLRAGDFEVLEHGRTCEVELVAPGDVPLAALLVVDTSGSVAGEKLAQLQRASAAFVAGLGRRDQALLLTFSHELRLSAPLTPDRDAVLSALASVTAGGRTSVHDALFSALSLASHLPGRPVVVVFSDGRDTASWVGPASALRAARESDTLVYAVGAGAPLLCGLTALTGGRCLADDGRGLQAAFERVLHELRTRYLLRVSPQSTTPGWHDIRVRLRRGDAQVRARAGFWRPR